MPATTTRLRLCRYAYSPTDLTIHRADMHAIHRPYDSADMPAITDFCWHRTATYTDNCCSACSIRPIDRAVMPTIYQTTDRRALCLTAITTDAYTVLLPEQTAAPACSMTPYLAALLAAP